jgi:hypothetical protein
MCRHPPWPNRRAHELGGAGTNPQKNNDFIISASVAGAGIGRISICKTVAQFATACSSGRIANQGLFCQAKRLPAGGTLGVPTQRSAPFFTAWCAAEPGP